MKSLYETIEERIAQRVERWMDKHPFAWRYPAVTVHVDYTIKPELMKSIPKSQMIVYNRLGHLRLWGATVIFKDLTDRPGWWYIRLTARKEHRP